MRPKRDHSSSERELIVLVASVVLGYTSSWLT